MRGAGGFTVTDEQQEPQPIRFTQVVALIVDTWPAVTSFTEAWLASTVNMPHVAVDGDTVTFTVANGGAVYRLRRDLDPIGGAIRAELEEGHDDAALKRNTRKFDGVPVKQSARTGV